MADRLTDTWRPWFETAFDKAALNEAVSWDMSFALDRVQTPKGSQIKPGIVIYAQLPSATIGDTHMVVAQMGSFGISEEVVLREVRAIVEKLFEMRSQALSLSNGLRWPPDGAVPIRPPGG